MLHKRKRSASPVFQNTPLIKRTILTRIILNNERARRASPPPKREKTMKELVLIIRPEMLESLKAIL